MEYRGRVRTKWRFSAQHAVQKASRYNYLLLHAASYEIEDIVIRIMGDGEMELWRWGDEVCVLDAVVT